jgi:signal transduction histidine kinase
MLDSTFMRRILANLFTNAIQAMPNGGKLSVKAFRKAKKVFITVKDTGIGIPKDMYDKIFQPMFTTKSKGQGFGLAVVKRMIEAQGGTISVESKEGKGAKFIIRLPISERKQV